MLATATAALGASVTLGACGEPAKPPADAGGETDVDGGPGIERDAGADAGVDGGPDWVRVPLPEPCQLEQATASNPPPAAAWMVCPDDLAAVAPSCRMWPPPPEGHLRFRIWKYGTYRGEQYFAFVDYDDVAIRERTWRIQVRTLAGEPRGYFRQRAATCQFSATGFRTGGFLLGMGGFDMPDPFHVVLELDLDAGYGDPAVEVMRWDAEAFPRSDEGILREFSASDDLLAAIRPLNSVLVARPDQAWVRRGGSSEEVSLGPPENPHVIGEHVFYEDWGRRIRLLRASFDEASSVALEVEGGDIRALGGNDESLVWMQAYGPYPNYDRVEVWTSTVDLRTGELERPRVLGTALRQGADVAGSEWYGAVTTGAAEFFHLETGEHRIFEPPTGWDFGGANPMAGDTTLLEAVNDSNPDLRNIIRFDITDLPLADE